jgi:hypothetical protein
VAAIHRRTPQAHGPTQLRIPRHTCFLTPSVQYCLSHITYLSTRRDYATTLSHARIGLAQVWGSVEALWGRTMPAYACSAFLLCCRLRRRQLHPIPHGLFSAASTRVIALRLPGFSGFRFFVLRSSSFVLRYRYRYRYPVRSGCQVRESPTGACASVSALKGGVVADGTRRTERYGACAAQRTWCIQSTFRVSALISLTNILLQPQGKTETRTNIASSTVDGCTEID